MYPYELGCHLKSGQLCRIPHSRLGLGIPQGCAKVIKFRLKGEKFVRRPYQDDGELDTAYWSIARWCDIQRRLGEDRTGPNMIKVMQFTWLPDEQLDR